MREDGSHQIMVRVTPQVKKVLAAAAKKDGLSLKGWLTNLILRAAGIEMEYRARKPYKKTSRVF